MKFFFLLLVGTLLSISGFGQFSDDFSDGNLMNPDWQGDVGNFKVNDNGQLQLNAPDAGSSNLVLPTMVPDSAVWQLWLKMNFSPSNSNFGQVYLMAQSADLLTADAIYLQLGENGSNDAIHVRQRINGVEMQLASSLPGSIATGPVELSIQVEKIGTEWRLSVDYGGGQNLAQVATWNTTVNTTGSKYFGFHCQYSASRTDEFFYDDVSLQKWLPDTEAPHLIFAQADEAQKLILGFDEWIDESSLNVDHFSLSGNIGVADVGFVPGDSSKLVLFLSQDLQNGTTYTVSTQLIADRHGNLGSGSLDFIYLVPETIAPFDIVFNELMVDPSPSVGLPENEFVELYNRSDKVLDLGQLSLLVNSTARELPQYNLLPGGFVILVDEADTANWTNFGDVIGIDLPGLSNSGATLTLKSGTDVIHQIIYTDHSYRNKDKDDGGWSLELINPENPCLGELNWGASNSWQGGTPGQENSLLDLTYLSEKVRVVQVYPNTPTSITIEFDQSVGSVADSISNYSLDPQIGIASVSVQQQSVTLGLSSPMQWGVVYDLTIRSGITNCVGAFPTESTVVKIGLAEEPIRGDVIINEILFNPVTGGSDYVELLNVSNKIVDIGSFSLANTHKVGAIRTITQSGLLFPNQYVAFTPDRFQVIEQYQPPDSAWILENALPSLDDDQGNVSLIFGGQIIDSVEYSEDMHVAFVSSPDGVALERISPFGKSLDAANWISGASQMHYGTPGYRNSQFSELPAGGGDFVEVRQKVFSPNGDGFEDFVLFGYDLPGSGYTLNSRIYTAAGQYVNRLVNNEIVGQKGTIRWDGVGENGELLSAGIYVVRFEFFKPDGEKIVELESCGLVLE